ncbi:signal peptidase I [Chryseobacterium lathyri]|uniref:Signal peptidase I n=1 Tax=Chryseobacterium lathyri TaxID=395933 RepID=A0ABT9SMU5_9FLAO|nr:signal peptidase I [Chryseobacterium lathyri]
MGVFHEIVQKEKYRRIVFKNKIFNTILLTGSVIVTLFIIAKLTGVLQYAFVPEAGSESTVKKRSFVVITNILPYDKNKLLIYYQDNIHGKGMYIQRLVGVYKDKVQIKNGELYVNDIAVDAHLNLKHSYKIDRAFVNELMMKGFSENDFFPFDQNHFVTNLSKNELDNNFFHERFINTGPDHDIFKAYGKDWTADNFGPIIIPKGKVFFLGDNRNASLDSRYTGLINEEEIKGRVIYPKN